MRKLATVRQINRLEPIPDALAIEKATVDGWEVVVKKGDFKVGDKCVYIEIDSIVDKNNPAFDFLSKRKYRVRTIRLRKQTSEGIVFKLSDLGINGQLGDDLTERLKITKYDPQLAQENALQEQTKRGLIHKYLMRYKWYRGLWVKKTGWPTHILKTDEERIQNRPSLMQTWADKDVVITEKLDGQSASFSYKRVGLSKKVFICSRNICFRRETNNNYWRIFKGLNLKQGFKNLNQETTIQGEILGSGIQKNKYHVPEDHLIFRVFNMHDIPSDTWLGYDEMSLICELLDITVVPIIYRGKLSNFAKTVPEIVLKANDMSKIYPFMRREGIVVRLIGNSVGRRQESFKVVNPEFLLGLDEDE